MPLSNANTVDLERLRDDVTGRIITPADADYDTARTVFMGTVDRRPAGIVRVEHDDDVAAIVTFARDSGVELAVRSGGHSSAGHSVSEGGLVLDLREMRALDIDVDGRTAWAEGGLTAGEYSRAADEHGLATGFGDTGSVGIGGLTVGGGVGYLVRKYGLTIDDLLAADVVTADGKLRCVDAENEPDLFWAIRGGGGNFGVVTRFRFRLHDVGEVVGGMLILPATAQTIHEFIAAAEAAPEELSAIGNVMPVPPMPFVPAERHGEPSILALMVHAGPVEEGERAVAPFRALAEPIVDMVKPMRYPEIYPPDDPSYRPVAAARTMFVDSVDRGVAETIVAQLDASDAAMSVAQLRVLGGAMARVPSDATAFAHRGRGIMVNLAALYERPEDEERHETWVDGFVDALADGNPGAYVNFLGEEGTERVRQAYPGSTWDRLAAVKRRYDPDNLFRLNQNIPPASG